MCFLLFKNTMTDIKVILWYWVDNIFFYTEARTAFSTSFHNQSCWGKFWHVSLTVCVWLGILLRSVNIGTLFLKTFKSKIWTNVQSNGILTYIFDVSFNIQLRGGFADGPPKRVDTSQLHQSRLGLLSQAFMLIIIVGFLFSETLSEFWKKK